ncbi:MAG: alpha/beta fold hydrolase [Promethearchaeota archaeon]
MSFADVNGIKIFYEIHGEQNDEPLILVHGFGASRLVWRAQVKPLSEHFKVIIFDNRGAGKSDRPNEPYTMEMFADDLNGLMEYLKIDKANILGWSLGGMIVQTFAIKYPERVKKLILINTLPRWPGDEKGLQMYIDAQIKNYEEKIKDPLKAFFDGAIMGFSRQFVKQMKEDPKKKFYGLFSAEDIAKDRATDPATPQDIKNNAHALGNFDVVDKLHEIKAETLIICAEKDRQTPKSQNEIIHEKIPNSKLIVIPKVGHDSPFEKAPEINQYIIDFLKSK